MKRPRRENRPAEATVERLCQHTRKGEPARQMTGETITTLSPSVPKRGLPEGYTRQIPPEIRPL